jgi:uncharacterized protein
MHMSSPSVGERPDIALQPTVVAAGERIQILDTLRGFALFGVLIVNMYDWLGEPSGRLDRYAHAFVELFFENKAWPLLSLLFGLGFAIQIQRAREKGKGVVRIHLRRMLVLYGFGIVLMAMFAGNPILLRYAALGLLLLPFAWLPSRAVLAAALLFFLVSTCDRTVWNIYRRAHPSSVQPQAPERPLSLTQITLQRFRDVPGRVLQPDFWAVREAELFTMFLMGLYIGKRRLHADVDQRLTLMRRVTKWALPLGIAGTICAFVWTVHPGLVMGVLHRAVEVAGGDLQSFGYAASIGLLALRTPSANWVRLLAYCGRMPLTNYLAQWLLMRLIFDRFFFGAGGHVGPAGGVLIAIGIFILQLGWSRLWLMRFQFGPAEWVWKTLTYLRMQPWMAKAHTA